MGRFTRKGKYIKSSIEFYRIECISKLVKKYKSEKDYDLESELLLSNKNSTGRRGGIIEKRKLPYLDHIQERKEIKNIKELMNAKEGDVFYIPAIEYRKIFYKACKENQLRRRYLYGMSAQHAISKDDLKIQIERLKEKRIFVVPNNDAEANRIIEILEEREEDVFITNQNWGANWENLETKIKEKLKFYCKYNSKIYGVELQGVNPYNATNIDHHCYKDDDRTNEKSSLEQVSKIVGYHPYILDEMIIANDIGYIPAMEKVNASEETKERYIHKVRQLDRKAQGVTEKQEEQAIDAIENNLEKIGETIIINSPHSKCACYTDRLFGKYERLLIISEDGEINFYGDKKTISKLFNKFEGWKGGNIEEDNGYWGGYADKEDVLKVVKKYI